LDIFIRFSPKFKVIIKNVIHLIPYDGIGGVERAAATMRYVSTQGIEFHVETIFPPTAAKSRWVVWNPWFFLCAVVRLWKSRTDVLVVSLWRAYVVGILVKLLRPKLRLVVFLHFPQAVHGLDRFFTSMGTFLACRVWADSKETLNRRVPALKDEKGHVISFVTDRIAALPSASVRPTFMFWGRLHAQKGLSRAMKIFAAIKTRCPIAQFWIIGPDGGVLDRIQSELMALGLGDAVHILGPKNFAEIQQLAGNASFYLQTSELEGMAMSVVEAMQLGLVPVVTPVGEIAHYARHGKNALVVSDDSSTVEEVFELLENDLLYQSVRGRAVAAWADQPIYINSVLMACDELLRANMPNDVK
jgi:glycosyltransferase involved in cell wall biosynthesis